MSSAVRAALVAAVVLFAGCGNDPQVSEDLERQVTELEQDVADLGEQIDQTERRRQAEDAADFQRCYHDPDTEPWVPNLDIPAPGECD